MALFLSTLGSGVSGGPNVVLDQMNADIERDIDEQKSNAILRENRLAAEGSLIDMARRRYTDETVVDAAMREAAWRKVDAQARAFLVATAQNPARQTQAQALVNETEARVVEAERARRLANETDLAQRLAAAAEARRKAAAAAGAPKKHNKLLVPLWGAEAPTDSEAKEARVKSGQYAQIYDGIAKLRTYSRTLSPTDRKAAQGAINDLALRLKAKEGPGAGLSSENDMKLLSDPIANPTKLNVESASTLLTELERRVRNAERRDRESLGMAPTAPTLRAVE
jgi:hypothetical protein